MNQLEIRVPAVGRLPLLGLALLAPLAIEFPPLVAMSGPADARMVEGALLHDVLPREAIPAIDSPRFVGVSQAGAFMHPDEPVLGVASGEQAKCYSTWLLEGHEIVNDSLDGVPIAVTW